MYSPSGRYTACILQGYTPCSSDILCGRGKAKSNHPGNVAFMRIVRSSLKEYTNAGSRMEKTIVVTSVVSEIFYAGMRFLKQVNTKSNRYMELSSDGAHEKVGRAIRDLLKQKQTRKAKNKESINCIGNNNNNNTGNGKFSKGERLGTLRPVINPNRVGISGHDKDVARTNTSFAASKKNDRKRAISCDLPALAVQPQQQEYDPRHQLLSPQNTTLGLSELDVVFDEEILGGLGGPSTNTEDRHLQLALSALSEGIVCSSSSEAKLGGHNLLAIFPDLEHIFSTTDLVLDHNHGVSTNDVHQSPLQEEHNIADSSLCSLSPDSNVDRKFLDIDGSWGFSEDTGNNM